MSWWYPTMAVVLSASLSFSTSVQAAQPDLQYRVLGSNAKGDSLLRGPQHQQLLLQTLDLQWQNQLGTNQQFQLASTLWRTDRSSRPAQQPNKSWNFPKPIGASTRATGVLVPANANAILT